MLKYSLLLLGFLFAIPLQAQTKKIKRPKNNLGVSSVDSFVRESFDLYDKVYRYDGYAAAGKSLEDEDIDVLEDALSDVNALMADTPDILSDLDGEGALVQGKAALRINRAKKALKYSIKTAKDLLLGAKSTKGAPDTNGNETQPSNETNQTETLPSENESAQNTNGASTEFVVNSKFDFVPGDELIFFDDFSSDFIGDFPSKWNTNGSGEVISINNSEQRWFRLISGSSTMYIPDLQLPDEYTIEFDVLTKGIDSKTSSATRLNVYFNGDNNFSLTKYGSVGLPLAQYVAPGIKFYSKATGIQNTVDADLRKAVLNTPHISIAVNTQRLRVWVNEVKYVDVPRFFGTSERPSHLMFNVYGLKDGKENVYISNIKVAKGGVDLRKKLLSEGRISTNGILFDSGSANIKPQSYGILRQISQVLQQDKNMKLQIVGHTDSDGTDASNLTLSRKRAEAVKKALEKTYKIAANRITTDGKGASEPIADNTSPDGKAKNRRVVFIKQ